MFSHFFKCIKSSIVLQRYIRGFIQYRAYVKTVRDRLHATIFIQRVARRYLARCLTTILRMQQLSVYEQLWDEISHTVYYYNRVTKTSAYDPPDDYFRPLVRDFFSDTLIQAWPQLENPDKYLAPKDFLESSLCRICRIRSPVRLCHDCPVRNAYGQITYAAYCFTCFTAVHMNEKEGHNYKNYESPTFDHLKCVECDLPATRKCQGCISDKKLQSLCDQLKRSPLKEWEDVLKSSKVFEERKLKAFMTTLRSSTGVSVASQWQQVKTLLERVKSECDECYCYDCYKDIHSGGKRSAHVWLGFREYSPVCTCYRSPKQVQCMDCGDAWCTACFKVLHSMGRKRKHMSAFVLENNPFNAPFCNECSRRVGTIPCARNCGFVGCDSCYECIHIPECPNRLPKERDGSFCVVCGEPADSKCVECRDLYCSRKWMGNPGCFTKNHSKGNRVNHRLLSLI